MDFLTDGILSLTWQQLVMYAVGITLIWLAIKKGYEPALLLPMGFGAILVNLPFSGVLNQTLSGGIQANGVIEWLFHVGIETSEVMPILLFKSVAYISECSFQSSFFLSTKLNISCTCLNFLYI